MKKLYAIAAGLLASVSASAQLYVVGEGDGLGWDVNAPMEVTANAEGNYSFTVNNLNQFKMSPAKGGWDAFNAKALYCEVTGSTLGTPIALTNGDANIRTPWPGDYTITVAGDLSTATFTTTTPKPVEKIDVYLRGDMNGWGTDGAWKFETEDFQHYSLTCKIPAGQQFKIADANWSRVNYGGQADYGTYTWWFNGSNAFFSFDFEGTISFDLEPGENSLEVTFTEPPFVEPGVEYSIYGNIFAESTASIARGMTLLENGKWQLADVYTDGGLFWIQRFVNGTLESTFGRNDSDSKIPELDTTIPVSAAAGAEAWWLDRGYYTFTFNAKNRTITVSGNVYPDKFEIPETLFMIGNVNGFEWATDKGVEATKNGDMFTVADVTVDPSEEGSEYGYFSFVPALAETWEAINESDRYGAATANAEITLGKPSMMFIYRGADSQSESCKSWQIEPGNYDITIDFAEMNITVAKAGDGVSDITINEEAPVYYNLQGIRVANPRGGIFIEVRGNSTRKVSIK